MKKKNLQKRIKRRTPKSLQKRKKETLNHTRKEWTVKR